MIPPAIAANAATPPAKPTKGRRPIARSKAEASCRDAGLTVIKMGRLSAMADVGSFMSGEMALDLGRGVLAFSMSAATVALEELQGMLEDPIVQAAPELRLEVLKATISASSALGKQGEAIVESTKVAPPEVPSQPTRAAFSVGKPLDSGGVTIHNAPGGTVQLAAVSPKSGQES